MRIDAAQLEAIQRHGVSTYPEECCGLLLGVLDESGNRVAEVWPVENRHEGDRSIRYTISPADYLAAEEHARGRGVDVVGFYHSHPDHPAEPSPRDLEDATFPWYTYVIANIQDGVPGSVRAWLLEPDRSAFAEDTIVVNDSIPSQPVPSDQ